MLVDSRPSSTMIPPSPNEIREKYSKFSICQVADTKSQNTRTTKSTTPVLNNNETIHTKVKEFWHRSTKSLRKSATTATTSQPQHDEGDTDLRMKKLRKVGVAVAGGTLIAVGIPLVPLPGPGDVMIVGGVALLATEFPAAQKLIDGTRDKVSDFVQDDDQVQEDTALNVHSISKKNHTTPTTSPTPQESIRTGAKWVGKQILPVLDHFATVSPPSQSDATTIVQNLSDNHKDEKVDSPIARKSPLLSPNTTSKNYHNLSEKKPPRRIYWM